MKTIFHLNMNGRLNHCYANVRNLHEHEDVTEIIVLLNGESAELAVDNPKIKALTQMSRIVVMVCNNSLKSLEIEPDTLMGDIIVVPTGVYTLVEKQHEGYYYIKP